MFVSSQVFFTPGHAMETKVKETLQKDLKHIFKRRYKADEFELLPPRFTIIVRDVSG